MPLSQRIEKVHAFPLTKPRIIGDLGLRAFFQLTRRALKLIKHEKIDFIYIPIPSFYSALIGRYLHLRKKIKYGIDYIDPWVHLFPGSDKIFSRHWFSTQLAKMLEPVAVKHASLITGVAEGYYKGVQDRNPYLIKTCLFGAMPYGGEEEDHLAVKRLALKSYLFEKNGKLQMIYAGAMLPNAYIVLEEIFRSISENHNLFDQVEFHFIGTGKTPNDPNGYNIKPIAKKYGLWNSVVFEYPKRIPYLDVLTHLEEAGGVFVLGSTEPHYTPSKIYQGVLSKKPILAVLHEASTAANIIRETKAGIVLSFKETELSNIKSEFLQMFISYTNFYKDFKAEQVEKEVFNQYSAQAVALQLSTLLNQATGITS